MDGVTQAHGKLLKDTSIQFHFPSAPAPEPAPLPSIPFHINGSVVFWVVVACAVAGIIVIVVSQLRSPHGRPGGRPGKQAQSTPHPGLAAAVAVPRAALDEADALAEAGRYGDAVHALLLRGVGAIQGRFPRALAPSHTSRDIAALPVLPDATRHAFAGIALRTERAVFARAPLDRSDWDACRALYAGLLAPPAQVSRS